MHYFDSKSGSDLFVLTIRPFTYGLILLSLLLLSACCSTPTIQVKETEYVYPPKSLTVETPLGLRLEDSKENADLLQYGTACKAALQMCNSDKRRIREFEQVEGPDSSQ